MHAEDGSRLNVLENEMVPALAVILPVWLVLTRAALAPKLAVVRPEVMVTLSGGVRFELSLPRETANPVGGAASVMVTVQEMLPGVLSAEFMQVKPSSTGREGERGVITPEIPVMGTAELDGSEAIASVNWTVIGLDASVAIRNVAVATMPSAIVVLLRPKTMHVLSKHVTDLLTLVAEGPETTLISVTAEG